MAPQQPSLLSLPTYSTASQSRLQALYSNNISWQKNSDPAGFHASIEWWRRTFEAFIATGIQTSISSRLVLNASARISENLRVEGVGKPAGLSTVITELIEPSSSKSPPALIPLSAFLSLSQSIYASHSLLHTLPSLVASYLITKPLWWALGQIGIDGLFASNAGDSKWHGEYVILSLLERAAEKILVEQKAKSGGPSDGIYAVEGFRRDFAACINETHVMSETDAKVLIKFLERDQSIITVDKEVIKFIDKDAPTETWRITAVDRGILELKSAVANLHDQIEGLQKKIDLSTQKAAEALGKKRQSIALSYIRSRKHLQDVLSKRLGALDTLEGTLIRVEAAAANVQIIESYAQSTSTLRAILSHPLLQRESIEQTMEAMADANADAKEIDEALRVGGDIAVGANEVFDEDELQAELNELIQESKEEEDVKALEEKQHLRKDESIRQDVNDMIAEDNKKIAALQI
ncbi:Snf7-domain-containing protein [Desarmillaria ectypa]|nr:Snf7-domain-containing protein [Desarmillaria ectypa]